MQVPLLDLKGQFIPLKQQIMKEIEGIADSQYFILGPKVEKFEKEAADYCHAKFACGVSSGSDALLLSLMVAGIHEGDEVITTPFTFFATAGAIARTGAKIVFADINPETFNINPKEIEAKITTRTKALIPVHLFGQCADMDPILEIAKKHKLVVIEDAAQAIGSCYKGKFAGSMGDFGCFSFFPSKNLGCFGDAGLVTTDNPETAEKLKFFRNHGMNPKYYHKFVGGNFRIDALQAAILSIKLPHLDDWSKARQNNAEEYRNFFAESSIGNKVATPVTAEYTSRHIFNQFSILVRNGKRDQVRQALLDAKIGNDIYYPVPLHMQECFRNLGYREGDFPVSESVANMILALPIYPESTAEQRKYVVSTIEKALK